MQFKGIDVSRYQVPSSVPYEALAAAGYSFVYVKATNDIRPDPAFEDHVSRAQHAGLAVGAYHFWMQSVDPVAQAMAYRDTVSAAGMGDGWLIPALDLEWQPGKVKASPSLFAGAKTTARLFADWYGDAIIYTAASFWIEIGRPDWWLDYPTWIAHYGVPEKDVKSLAGKRWSIWQHASAPIDGLYPKDLDQNVARELLTVSTMPTYQEISEQFLSLDTSLESQRAARDEYIRDTEDDS